MKQVVFVLVAACAAIVIGCVESTPIGSTIEPHSGNSLAKASPTSDPVIEFRTVVGDGSGDSYEIEGRVKYGLTQRPILSEEIFDLTLNTEAKVAQVGDSGNSFVVNEVRFEVVNLTGQSSALVDEVFFLRGGPRSLDLHLQFRMTAEGVSLVAVTIE
jgi:hypothetical protein